MILGPTLPPPVGLAWWALACVTALVIRPVAKPFVGWEWLWLGIALWRTRLALGMPADVLALTTIALSETPFWAGVTLDVVGTVAALDFKWDVWQGDIWLCLLTAQFIANDVLLPHMALRAVVALLVRSPGNAWFWAAVLAQGNTRQPAVVAIGTWLLAEITREWIWVGLVVLMGVQVAANTIKALRGSWQPLR